MQRRLIFRRLLPLLPILLGGSGCSQQVVYREFYAPADGVCQIRDDGSTVGAVKVEATRDGVPDWSDSKHFSISLF